MPASTRSTPPQSICWAAVRNGEAACFAVRESKDAADQMNEDTSSIDIPIAGCRPPFEEKRKAGPSKMPTPAKPPTRPSQIIGGGLGGIPIAQPKTTRKIETLATISAANPVSIYCSEIVTPPLPARSKQAPIISDVRQFAQLDLPALCDQAIPYMITPANRNRMPAIRNGGMLS